jgi:CubicO group peptidase (beta-lactamase class C family)
MSATAALDEFLLVAIRREITPGVVALVAHDERILHHCVWGDAQRVPTSEPMAADTIFDLASLTKPLVTAALALVLEDELDLRPDRLARTLLPELGDLDHADITLEHLLTHASGLPAWRPLFLRGESAEEYLKALRHEALEELPGRKVVYSDPGYMAVGEMLRRASGMTLDRLFQEVLGRPLGLEAGFCPPSALADRAAATEVGQAFECDLAGKSAAEYGGWREGVIKGQVHDHHTWVAGGVLGSAGLFAGAADLHRMGQECLGGGRTLLSGRVMERMRMSASPPGQEARSHGFALNTAGRGSCGPALPESAFGHVGFTGTSLWLDPEGRRIYVLLTNRVHPQVGPGDMLEFRREFHQLAAGI